MYSFKPIKVPHGSISKESAIDAVFGRDALVERLWKRIESKSIRVLSERRVGKTWTLRLAEAKAPEWASCLFIDVEACRSLEEFVIKFNQELHKNKLVDESFMTRVTDWFRTNLQRFTNSDSKALEERVLKTVAKLENWDELLERSIEQWIEHCEQKKPVLMIDELPFLLDKLQQSNPESASHLLDKLREIRLAHSNVRMVFCGSLGLHIVLDKLHEKNYHGQPINDMPPFEVPPLESEDAVTLAGGLLLDEEIPCEDMNVVAESVANQASRVPFYIEKLIAWIVDHPEESWNSEAVEQALYNLFHAAGDPGEFAYYENRIGQYYKKSVQEKALIILDVLCRNESGESQEQLLNLLHHHSTTLELDANEYLKLLRMLKDDHYIVRCGDLWCFKMSIVRKWWLDQRGSIGL